MTRHFRPFVWTLFLSVGGVSPQAPAQTDSLWLDPYETDDGILVYTREIPGLNILELRAVCLADVSPAIAFRTAMRRDTYRHTSKYVVEYQIIRTDQSNVWYTYQRLAIPLFRDRDYTLRYEASRDSLHERYALVWTIANDKGPPPIDNVVRIEVSRGALDIVPVDGGRRTRLTCTICADPGGSIPGWLANIGNRSTLPDLLRAIRDASMAERDSLRTKEN